MQPNITWDGFRNRRPPTPEDQKLEAQLAASIERVNAPPAAAPAEKPARKRTPAAAPAAPATVGDLLLQAVRLVAARPPQAPEVAIREATLVEVLGELMRGPVQ